MLSIEALETDETPVHHILWLNRTISKMHIGDSVRA